jgi:predicted glycosyltransferase
MPLVVFTGSFASTRDREALAAAAERSAVEIHPFGPEFVAALAGCALSVSRAGYNTCTALLRARTRAVLAPDPIMSDQRFRADRFAELGLARMVEGDPPPVNDLVTAIRAALDGPPPLHDFNLRGADGAEGCITSTKP